MMPMNTLSNDDIGMDHDNLSSYLAPMTECQQGRTYRSMTDPSISFCGPNVESKQFKNLGGRQPDHSLINNSHMQPQSSLPNLFQSIDDEFISMSPNALAFLDSLDHNNLIDDLWLPSE